MNFDENTLSKVTSQIEELMIDHKKNMEEAYNPVAGLDVGFKVRFRPEGQVDIVETEISMIIKRVKDKSGQTIIDNRQQALPGMPPAYAHGSNVEVVD